MSDRRQFDVGLVVPLKEEFEFVRLHAPVTSTHHYDGTTMYVLNAGGIEVICTVIGEMGPLPACISTGRLLQFADVKLVVVLGIAGSLDSDLCLGDVVIADRITEYLANSKAIPSESGFTLTHGGRHWSLEYKLRQCISQFDLISPKSYDYWYSQTQARHERLSSGEQYRPRIHIGSIASGDIVAASTAFVESVKAIDRKFLAIDMEAAGAMKAAADRLKPVPVLTIRGISDYADENKAALESESKGEIRKICVENAVTLLIALLQWDDFVQCAGIRESSRGGSVAIKEIIGAIGDTAGLVWLLGVALGVYRHAPVQDSGDDQSVQLIPSIVLQNERLETVFNRLDEIGKNIRRGSIAVQQIKDELNAVVEEYCFSMGLSKPCAALDQLDQVVETILDGTSSGVPYQSADYLEDIDCAISENLLDRASELLADMDDNDSKVRRRLVTLDFVRGNYRSVIGRLHGCSAEELSRSELENLIVSTTRERGRDEAQELIDCYRIKYLDSAANMFIRHVELTYARHVD